MTQPFDENAMQGDPLALPDDWYGPGTASMKDILRRGREIPWFNVPRPENFRERAIDKVQVLVQLLRELDGEHSDEVAVSRVEFLEGDWRLLHEDRSDLCPYNPWGTRWERSNRFIFRFGRLSEVRIESEPHARPFIGPPLWLRDLSMRVCGLTIIAHQERLKFLGMKWGNNDWTVAWALLCDAESHLMAALTWEMAVGLRVLTGRNPFALFVELYELGVFPLGWAEDSFTIYVPKGTSSMNLL